MLRCALSGACSGPSEESPRLLLLRLETIATPLDRLRAGLACMTCHSELVELCTH
jgi:hypothetical protein